MNPSVRFVIYSHHSTSWANEDWILLWYIVQELEFSPILKVTDIILSQLGQWCIKPSIHKTINRYPKDQTCSDKGGGGKGPWSKQFFKDLRLKMHLIWIICCHFQLYGTSYIYSYRTWCFSPPPLAYMYQNASFWLQNCQNFPPRFCPTLQNPWLQPCQRPSPPKTQPLTQKYMIMLVEGRILKSHTTKTPGPW